MCQIWFRSDYRRRRRYAWKDTHTDTHTLSYIDIDVSSIHLCLIYTAVYHICLIYTYVSHIYSYVSSVDICLIIHLGLTYTDVSRIYIYVSPIQRCLIIICIYVSSIHLCLIYTSMHICLICTSMSHLKHLYIYITSIHYMYH